MKRSKGREPNEVETAIYLMQKAYNETYAAAVESGTSGDADIDEVRAIYAAKEAAVGAMPTMHDKASARIYIACIAWLHQQRWMSATDAKTCLFAAQTFIGTGGVA